MIESFENVIKIFQEDKHWKKSVGNHKKKSQNKKVFENEIYDNLKRFGWWFGK